MPASLQGAQARRVGRGDIHHQVVRQRRERGGAQHIVAGGVGAVPVLAEIDPHRPAAATRSAAQPAAPAAKSPEARSEEHTSELQSLMRISYAVFCLKKKNN